MMDSLANHGYSCIEDGTKVYSFLKGMGSNELKASVNVVLAYPEKYGKDFDATKAIILSLSILLRPKVSQQSLRDTFHCKD